MKTSEKIGFSVLTITIIVASIGSEALTQKALYTFGILVAIYLAYGLGTKQCKKNKDDEIPPMTDEEREYYRSKLEEYKKNEEDLKASILISNPKNTDQINDPRGENGE